MIRPEDQRLLQPCLLPGERLLWAGRPRRGLILRARDLYLVPASLFIAAFAVVWNLGSWSNGGPFLSAMGLFIAVVGLYALAGRFLHDAWLRARLLYAVSNRRVILLDTGPRRHLRSLEIGYLPMLELDQRTSDRGTLRFDVEEEHNPFFRNDLRLWMPPTSGGLSFEQIERPRMVYDIIVKETERRRRELFGAAVADPLFLG
jgi:hypothetical protein